MESETKTLMTLEISKSNYDGKFGLVNLNQIWSYLMEFHENTIHFIEFLVKSPFVLLNLNIELKVLQQSLFAIALKIKTPPTADLCMYWVYYLWFAIFRMQLYIYKNFNIRRRIVCVCLTILWGWRLKT